eukprot:gene10189-21235_t
MLRNRVILLVTFFGNIIILSQRPKFSQMFTCYLITTLVLLSLWNGQSFHTSGTCRQNSMRKSSVLMGQVPMVPYRLRKESKDYQWMDIYNALGRQRTLFVSRFLDDEACNQLIASLIYLQGENKIDPITMYFNVPGAILKPSFAVYDVMRRMSCPLITINMGLTVGMGSLLCAVGTKGNVCILHSISN